MKADLQGLGRTILLAAGAVVTAAQLHGQGFPDHPIKLVVAYPPGGPNDTVTRVTMQGLRQSPAIENEPILRESRRDGFPTAVWAGLVAPVGTPADVIARINAAENAQLRSAPTQAAVATRGFHTQALSPQEFAAVLIEQVRLWTAVVSETRVKLD